jgi:cytidylate kinase
LVAEGRDMTTVVFPNADLKVYLDASPYERAERRYKQLISKGNSVNIQDLTSEIEARDKRDKQRKASPLKIADDAKVLNTDDLTIGQTVDKILAFII